ncbi:serine hydroxymethyltransferase [Curtobacterium sp. NPDC098951]|uniref:serine hydroxymethyltransferase n=1 Tax=Curtobacterium sp. NPDC098951 TaxID=3363974 RepID=UPI000CD47D63|nr:serine hydroxymethyltransferase [Staphylococcus epidermidis]
MKNKYKIIDNQFDLISKGKTELIYKDLEVNNILDKEIEKQHKSLSLVASCCAVDPSILYATSSTLVNVTAEGKPGKRYHAGCEFVDKIEQLAIDRACQIFDAKYAGVQPHSASSANYQVLSAILDPGDTILGMSLDDGGHLTHGSKVTFSGNYYKAIGYHVDNQGIIDYDEVERIAKKYRPRLIICGATAYSQVVDFKKFREIADSVGAILMADISHIAGLVVTNRHPSPINQAHITTTCTHKQLAGPRGGLILSGNDSDEIVPGKNITFRKLLQKSIFPWMQGAPAVNNIAAKAVTFEYAKSREFYEYIGRIREIADLIASLLIKKGYKVIGNGTKNHTILVELPENITGIIAEKALEECSIIVNKNRIPGEKRTSTITSGLRIGTGALAQRYLDTEGCSKIVDLIDEILTKIKVIDDKSYELSEESVNNFKITVQDLCEKYPIKKYTQKY